jgi:LCP family protein required for cell wall assembly
MKYYLKVFFISFVCFALLIGGGVFAMGKLNLFGLGEETVTKEDGKASGEEEIDPSSELAMKFRNGDRINILVLGTDGGRSDTLMVASYDSKNKLADIISIPRDTYNHVEGRNASDQRKINAVYGFKGEEGGPEGLKKEVSKILGVPITYYVELDYEAVAKVVDTVGGVEVDIPFKMDYDDVYAKPKLHIHFKPGVQTLDGQDSLEYLRWRKNNDGSHSMGDLERVKRQQEFVSTAAKKAMGFKLPFVIKDVFSYLKTDMNIGDMLYLGTKGLGFDFSNLEKHTIPGEPGMKYKASYYFHDSEKTLEMMQEIYARTPNQNLPGEGTDPNTSTTGNTTTGSSN